MKNIFKVTILGLFSLILAAGTVLQNGYAFAGDNLLSIKNLEKLPKNSIYRYAYSKALANNTSYEEELLKEKNYVVPLSYDEYITYITKSKRAGNINTNLGTMHPEISTEARVLVNRVTGKVVRVEDFGEPYASVVDEDSTWSGGGFNINRIDDTSARFSSTGQFFIDNGSLTVGMDIVSFSVSLGGKTKVMTINCNMGW